MSGFTAALGKAMLNSQRLAVHWAQRAPKETPARCRVPLGILIEAPDLIM